MDNTTLILVILIPFAIGSTLAFASMMKIVALRKKWNPDHTYRTSVVLYMAFGFFIPFLLILFGLEFFLNWMYIAALGLPVYLGVSIILKREGTPGRPTAPSKIVKVESAPASVPAEEKVPETRPSTGKKSQSIPQGKSTPIFISYRRSDSADVSGRIYDRLISRFGKDLIFKDVDSIPLGLDFKEYLNKKVGECTVLLAILGNGWLEVVDPAGKRRLEDPADFVRIEIEAALERDIPVIPLLVQGAGMPREEALPAGLRKLAYRNGIPIRSDPDFHRDMDRLILALEKYVN
jgi:hypothetical protein